MEVEIGHEHEFLTLSDLQDGVSTRSSDGELWSMHASLRLPHLQAECEIGLVWGVETPLGDFFDDLALSWRERASPRGRLLGRRSGRELGWRGVKTWEAYEGGLVLSCSCDRLGHVVIRTDLRERSGCGWLVRAEVPLDAGQLESVADQMRRFFSYR